MLSCVVIVYLTDDCKCKYLNKLLFVWFLKHIFIIIILFNVSCKECDPGYYWINCSKTCEYPYFGQQCAQNCSCEKHLCNVMIGCENSEYNVNYFKYVNNFIENNYEGFFEIFRFKIRDSSSEIRGLNFEI